MCGPRSRGLPILNVNAYSRFINNIDSNQTTSNKIISFIDILVDPIRQLAQAHSSEEGQEINQFQSVKYQHLIDKLSVHPRYQYILVTTLNLSAILITFTGMIGSFVFMNPLFSCSNQSRNEREACAHLDQCEVSNYFTAVAKNALYSEKEKIRSTIQSIFALGLTIGTISLPIFSDAIGKRKIMLFIYSLEVIALCLMTFAIEKDIEWLMILSSTLLGISGSGMTVFGYILICDFCSVELRQRSLLLYCSAWGIAQMLFFVIYVHMPQWDKYLVFLMIIPTSILLIFLFFFKLESPAFAIFIKKDILLFEQIMQKLSKFNNITQNQKADIRSLAEQVIETVSHKNQQFSLKKTLKKIIQKKNLITCLCLVVPLVSYNFFYYSTQGSMERTGFNFGVSMLFIGFHEFLAYVSASFLTKYIRRRVGCIVSIIITCTVGLLFLLDTVKQGQAIQTVLAVIARISSVYSYCFILLMQTELLDVEIRSTAIAIIASIGEIARIIVPYLVTTLNNAGIHPIIVTSILFMTFGIPPILGLRQSYVPPDQKKHPSAQQDLVAERDKQH